MAVVVGQAGRQHVVLFIIKTALLLSSSDKETFSLSFSAIATTRVGLRFRQGLFQFVGQ